EIAPAPEALPIAPEVPVEIAPVRDEPAARVASNAEPEPAAAVEPPVALEPPADGRLFAQAEAERGEGDPGAAPPAAEEPAAEAPVPTQAGEPAPARASWLARLKQGLSKTRGNLAGLFTGAKIDEALYEELETALLMSDAGVETTQYLLESLRQKVRRERIQDAEGVRKALRGLL